MTASHAVLQAQTTEKVPLLQVSGLSKRYGDQYALADLSFPVRGQEVLGLIGPNGAGKTTLLEAIAGVLPVNAGRILWQGAPLSQARRRDLIFYLPDGLRPWDDQFVIRIVNFFATVYRRSRGDVSWKSFVRSGFCRCSISASMRYRRDITAGSCWRSRS